MIYDMRFALIDRQGDRRYAQIINGTFQVGKERLSTPVDLASFAHAILKGGLGGRFTSADGSKHGILGYGGLAREAQAYELEPVVASLIGVAVRGTL